MTDESILFSTEGAVATITINRPNKLNAMTVASADRMVAAVQRANADPAIRVLVVRGVGRAFSTGFDLSSINLDRNIRLGSETLEGHFEEVIHSLRDSRLTVVSAVHGPAAGVAVAIALIADLTLAARSAYFFFPFINLALIPDGGNTWLLTRLLGAQRAAGLAMLGGRLSADEAAAQGLIWRCVDDDVFDTELSATVNRLAELSGAALEQTKRAIQAAAENSLGDQLLLERQNQEELSQSPDFREGARAFLEKRRPVFNRR